MLEDPLHEEIRQLRGYATMPRQFALEVPHLIPQVFMLVADVGKAWIIGLRQHLFLVIAVPDRKVEHFVEYSSGILVADGTVDDAVVKLVQQVEKVPVFRIEHGNADAVGSGPIEERQVLPRVLCGLPASHGAGC
jgi:hypothetical protein